MVLSKKLKAATLLELVTATTLIGISFLSAISLYLNIMAGGRNKQLLEAEILFDTYKSKLVNHDINKPEYQHKNYLIRIQPTEEEAAFIRYDIQVSTEQEILLTRPTVIIK